MRWLFSAIFMLFHIARFDLILRPVQYRKHTIKMALTSRHSKTLLWCSEFLVLNYYHYQVVVWLFRLEFCSVNISKYVMSVAVIVYFVFQSKSFTYRVIFRKVVFIFANQGNVSTDKYDLAIIFE